MKRAAIYLRVSTQDQTTANQEHELRQAAERAGWQVAKVYKDHGISGAKGRNGRPAFDALCRDGMHTVISPEFQIILRLILLFNPHIFIMTLQSMNCPEAGGLMSYGANFPNL